MEQIIETSVLVPMLDLDAPVPQPVDQLADILKFFDTFLPAVPEQVIEVLKILEDNIPQRTLLCEPQPRGIVGGSADCRVSFLSPAAVCQFPVLVCVSMETSRFPHRTGFNSAS